MVTPFSVMTCIRPGRFVSFLPRRMAAVHSRTVTRKEDTVVWVMEIPPKMGMVK